MYQITEIRTAMENVCLEKYRKCLEVRQGTSAAISQKMTEIKHLKTKLSVNLRSCSSQTMDFHGSGLMEVPLNLNQSTKSDNKEKESLGPP